MIPCCIPCFHPKTVCSLLSCNSITTFADSFPISGGEFISTQLKVNGDAKIQEDLIVEETSSFGSVDVGDTISISSAINAVTVSVSDVLTAPEVEVTGDTKTET